MKLWRAAITGGLPKSKERAGGTRKVPTSQSFPRPFSPTLRPNFETIFLRVSSNRQLRRRKELTVLRSN